MLLHAPTFAFGKESTAATLVFNAATATGKPADKPIATPAKAATTTTTPAKAAKPSHIVAATAPLAAAKSEVVAATSAATTKNSG